MKPNTFANIDDFRSSELWERVNVDIAPKVNTHVLHSMRIEKMIYAEMREQVKTGLDEVEAKGAEMLDTFPSLVQDTFMSLYSLEPKRNDADTLTTKTRHFNAEILDYVMNSKQYPVIKSLCEGRELIAYEAVNKFTQCMLEHLGELRDSYSLNKLDDLERHQDELKAKVMDAMERNDPGDEDNVLDMADSIAANEQKIERLSRKVGRSIRQNKDALQSAVDSAMEAAQGASYSIKAWGSGDSSPEALQQNAELLRRVQSSEKLRDIIKYLGKYREILDNARKSGFSYGIGEKYDIVLGNDYTRALSSEYAYLATPETIPLFIRKVQRKTLKQYRKRERISEGRGDIVVCIDESGSMTGDPIAWAKAVALVLLEHATRDKRRCAMVRFASKGQTKTHLFEEGKYTVNDVFNFAESFLCGGTDFETPLKKAVTLIENKGFEKADVMFITDGACGISDKFAEDFREKNKQLKFKVTGIVIGEYEDFSLEPFCEKVYRLGQMSGNDIAADVITRFVR